MSRRVRRREVRAGTPVAPPGGVAIAFPRNDEHDGRGLRLVLAVAAGFFAFALLVSVSAWALACPAADRDLSALISRVAAQAHAKTPAHSPHSRARRGR